MWTSIDQEGKEKLYTLKYLTTRLDKFLDDLLYYSRVGKTDLSIKEVDLNELVKDVHRVFKITIKEKKIEIKLHKLQITICDETRERKYFVILLQMLYTFYVKDNGIGIPDKYYDVIFKISLAITWERKIRQRFRDSPNHRKKSINQHGGNIWVESIDKQGTTLYFTRR